MTQIDAMQTNAETLKEYFQLWEEHGVETELLKQKIRLKKSPQSLKTKRTKSLPNPKHHTSLLSLQESLSNCKLCGLCKERNSVVFGSGNSLARLLFVGEGPGADEDEKGLPFIGRAGQLLTKILEAMKYTREEVYIANIVKCRPPGNRTPLPEEIETCTPFLKAQIDLIQPQLIVALGLTAANYLTHNETSMALLRGRFHPLFWNPEIPVMPTYHPAYLLRNPSAKKIVWEDMKLVTKRLKK